MLANLCVSYIMTSQNEEVGSSLVSLWIWKWFLPVHNSLSKDSLSDGLFVLLPIRRQTLIFVLVNLLQTQEEEMDELILFIEHYSKYIVSTI